MSYVVNKTGDFSGYHEVHKDACPNRPTVTDSYLINKQFENDLDAMEYVKEIYPSLQVRPCLSCMDTSSR